MFRLHIRGCPPPPSVYRAGKRVILVDPQKVQTVSFHSVSGRVADRLSTIRQEVGYVALRQLGLPNQGDETLFILGVAETKG